MFISGTVRACRLCHDQVLFTLSSVSQIRQIASKIDDVTPVYREDFGSRLGRVDDSAIYRVSSSNMLHGLQDRSLAAGIVSPSRAAFSPTTQQLGYLPLSKSLNGQKDTTTSSNNLFSPLQLENTHKARRKSAFTETIEANLRRRKKDDERSENMKTERLGEYGNGNLQKRHGHQSMRHPFINS